MDDDIQDILASVSAPTIPQRKLDLQALTRAWVNERTAPELLPYPTRLIERVMERVKEQIATIEEMTANMDPKSNFALVILQTELERVKFLIRSFLRARIAKIDKYPHHYLTLHQEQQTTTTTTLLLSPLESQYAHRHQSLLNTHYASTFLSAFPPTLQRLDDSAGGISMVDKPDEESAVFCRVLRDAGKVVVHGAEEAGEVELRRGEVWVLRWGDVREKVGRGEVEMV